MELVWWDGPVATDVGGMQGAVLDLWLLGQADDMLASHGSTFGYVAHGRVGRPPVLVTETGSCVRELSAEPCLHVWAFMHLTKCYDKAHMAAWFSRELCHPFDTGAWAAMSDLAIAAIKQISPHIRAEIIEQIRESNPGTDLFGGL